MPHNSRLLIAGANGNIGWMDPTTLVYTPWLTLPSGETISALAYIADNDLWVGVNTGYLARIRVYHYNGSTWTLHHLGSSGYSAYINDILYYDANNIYVAYYGHGAPWWSNIYYWNGTVWSLLSASNRPQGIIHLLGSGKSGGMKTASGTLEVFGGTEYSHINMFFKLINNSWSAGTIPINDRRGVGFARNSHQQTWWLQTYGERGLWLNSGDIISGTWSMATSTAGTNLAMWADPYINNNVWYTSFVTVGSSQTTRIYFWDGSSNTEIAIAGSAIYRYLTGCKDSNDNTIIFTAGTISTAGHRKVHRRNIDNSWTSSNDVGYTIGLIQFPTSPLFIPTTYEVDIEETAIQITDQLFAAIETSATHRYQHEWNQFDEFGSLVGLRRLKGEKNWEYKRRILDVFTHLANSSYQGLVHGVTRELNLSLFNAIEINPVVDINTGAFLTTDPYIVFDNAYLNLYSDYQNNTLESQINRHQPGGNFEHLNDLIAAVNLTGNFEASLSSEASLFTRSMAILNQSNRKFVTRERIPVSKKFQLKNRYLSKGTVFFSNRDVFHTEKTTVEEIISPGHYHIDYTTGVVTVYHMPPDGIFVRYQYTQYPFIAIASPVILADINIDSFKIQMFEQVLQNNGLYVHGVATELGTDIINELYSIVPMYWGK